MKLVRGLGGTKHTRSTIAFDGTAGNGAIGTVTVFTITGRVNLLSMSAFCTETLAGATATISLGVASAVAGLIAVTTATDLAINEWWNDATPTELGLAPIPAAHKDILLSQTVSINVLVAAVSNGTIVFDVWYVPATDNGRLS